MRDLKQKDIELLAPAGSLNSAKAAINAGADAVYMGGPLFSARAYAESSSPEGLGMLREAVDFCRLRGRKLYFTLNTLVKEKEFPELEKYLDAVMANPPDAVIVADLGVLGFLKEKYPFIKIHISTQAAVTGPGYAALLADLGASRIVLARELSLEGIREISNAADAEIEVFAHGALCYSFSGQCLMSSILGGRSGNRGRCAGACRLPFDIYRDQSRMNSGRNIFPLSMKDLNTVSRLTEMLSAGATSFKIEGRMKSPEYSAAVVSIYRKYLDMAVRLSSGKAGAGRKETLSIDENDIRVLGEVFERGGWTDGYLDGKNGRDMVVFHDTERKRIRDEELIAKLRHKYIDSDLKVPAVGKVRLKTGEPARFTLTAGEVTVEAAGENIARKADKRPLSAGEIFARMSKTGNTEFYLEKLDIDTDGESFLSVGELNRLRRTAFEALRDKIIGNGRSRVIRGKYDEDQSQRGK